MRIYIVLMCEVYRIITPYYEVFGASHWVIQLLTLGGLESLLHRSFMRVFI